MCSRPDIENPRSPSSQKKLQYVRRSELVDLAGEYEMPQRAQWNSFVSSMFTGSGVA